MIERRFTPAAAAQVVMRKVGDKQVIEGYASVFYDGTPATEFVLWEGCVERIAPGAFDKAIRESDVRCLFNHDPSLILGRTAAKTCQLSVDKVGLRYACDPPETQVGRDVPISIARGDVTGCSFAMWARSVTWKETPDLDVRLIEEVELYDVGPVTYPAYAGTSVGVRSLTSIDELRAEHEKWKKGDREAIDAEMLQRDLRVRELRAREVR